MRNIFLKRLYTKFGGESQTLSYFAEHLRTGAPGMSEVD